MLAFAWPWGFKSTHLEGEQRKRGLSVPCVQLGSTQQVSKGWRDGQKQPGDGGRNSLIRLMDRCWYSLDSCLESKHLLLIYSASHGFMFIVFSSNA